MARLAPIFTEVYRYYLRKLKVLVGQAKSGVPLTFDFVNPKQEIKFDWVLLDKVT